MEAMFRNVALAYGPTKVQIKGKKNPIPFHEAVQAVQGQCSCTYKYAGNANHLLKHLPNKSCQILTDTTTWLHEKHPGR